ncbi:MAG TPA: tRNA (guanosine(46)-N7)-methyltransferase TrmB [Methylomirabilota bacterium]|nr:tRNA (guanosine(46)-N7)-methyltransferase TrmB [Methylomirabilota bacterium]
MVNDLHTSGEDSLLLAPASYLDRLHFAELFANPHPVEVEIGAGDGSFIVNYAAAHPERNFFAIERLLGRLRKIDRKGRRNKLTNLRGFRIEASYALEFMLPVHGAEALHIYFPDPWPKRKHRRNRLINEAFPALAKKCLVSKGVVYLRTDDLDYFQQMVAVFGAASDFARIETPAELKSFVTDFERNFHARGVPTNHAAYQRRD